MGLPREQGQHPDFELRSESGWSKSEEPTRELVVALSRSRIVVHLLCTYSLLVAVVLLWYFFSNCAGAWGAFVLLNPPMAYLLRGATLLYYKRPALVVNAVTGISVRHPALLGEKFVPLGPKFELPWHMVERWELSRVRLPCGLATGVTVLKVYLHDAESFVNSQGFLCGRLRFFKNRIWFGTPVVLTDLLLGSRAEAVAGFMNEALQRRQYGNAACDLRMLPFSSAAFV